MNTLEHKRVLVTAGPTYEAIDPVRFIGNRSTGKMGLAIVERLLNKQCHVVLIHGPLQIPVPTHKNLEVISIESAEEMYRATMKSFPTCDIGIFSAAVADYTPVHVADQKIKKSEDTFFLALKKTVDILKEVGKTKKPTQCIIGFALETNDEEANAMKKIEGKNLDAIVLNSLNDAGAGFAHETNKIKIIQRNGEMISFELKNKSAVANDIVEFIEKIAGA